MSTADVTTKTMPMQLRQPERLAQLALLLAFCFDWLFVGQWLGISVFLFAGLVVAGLVWTGWRQGQLPSPFSLVLLLPLLFFAAMVAVRNNAFLTFLNVSAVSLLLVLFVNYGYGYNNRRGLASMGLLGLFLTPPLVVLQALLQAQQPVRLNLMRLPGREKGWRALLPILRGILLAIPILMVLTLLLAAADQIFANLVAVTLWDLALPTLFNWLWRSWLLIAVSWLLTGSLVFAMQPGDRTPTWSRIRTWSPFGWLEAMTILFLTNGLFALFVWVQFTYLFGGRENIDLNGFTYAEYARRGFFEIVIVACLTFGLILTLSSVTRRTNKREFRSFNFLSTLLVGMVLVMLVSAFWRMSLYEAAYGFTRLRVYSHVFMVWLGFVLFWLVATLWRHPEWFAVGFLVGSLGFIVTLNLLNPDAFIVRQNLARLATTGDTGFLTPPGFGTAVGNRSLDGGYLALLSDDAVPILTNRLDHVPEPMRTQLARELTLRLARYENNRQWRRWPAFHFGRQAAYRQLQNWAIQAGG